MHLREEVEEGSRHMAEAILEGLSPLSYPRHSHLASPGVFPFYPLSITHSLALCRRHVEAAITGCRS